MIYRPDPQKGSARFYREPRSRSKLPYRTVKEMRELYPDDNFAVIGEIGGFAQSPNSGDLLITETGKAIPVLPRGSLRKPFEWFAGYIAVGGNTYLAAVRGLLPAFLRRRQETAGKPWKPGG